MNRCHAAFAPGRRRHPLFTLFYSRSPSLPSPHFFVSGLLTYVPAHSTCAEKGPTPDAEPEEREPQSLNIKAHVTTPRAKASSFPSFSERMGRCGRKT